MVGGGEVGEAWPSEPSEPELSRDDPTLEAAAAAATAAATAAVVESVAAALASAAAGLASAAVRGAASNEVAEGRDAAEDVADGIGAFGRPSESAEAAPARAAGQCDASASAGSWPEVEGGEGCVGDGSAGDGSVGDDPTPHWAARRGMLPPISALAPSAWRARAPPPGRMPNGGKRAAKECGGEGVGAGPSVASAREAKSAPTFSRLTCEVSGKI